ncbi:MAG: GTP 3',8-cyclase MoaA [Phycisphaerales bacterium]|nr:MAG: GTP 3',8-cyclase MoaA [Phycisphaerales bacterium]
MGVNYLRVSVTDACNLRCLYCNPTGCCEPVDRREVLRFEEIHRVVALLAEYGVSKVRLTGGEPLLRKDLPVLVEKLASTAGIEQVMLTTNGVLLEQMASRLKAAGLNRVNISLDSIDREGYRRITGSDLLQKVMRGVREAIRVGLVPVKINCVVLKGINESEIPALARLGKSMPVTVRFIEYCPTVRRAAAAIDYVPNNEVREIIEREHGALSQVAMGAGDGPAVYFKAPDSAGIIGFISGRSSAFCSRCNRLRLTSDGRIKPCLHSPHSYDLKELIRNGAGDRQVRSVLEQILSEKPRYTKLNSRAEEFSMCKVGG